MTRLLARSRDESTAHRTAHACRLVVLTALLAGLFTLLLSPPQAQAHLVGGTGSPTNYRATVTAIQPAAPAVAVGVGLGGQWVHLVNRSASEIVVLGSQGEPFLRLAQHRVQANERSSTAGVVGLVAPPRAGAPAEPRWMTLRESDQVTWTDPRVGASLPGGTTAITWRLPLLVDGQQVTVTGNKERLPAPTIWAWLAALLVLAAAVSALGWLRNWYRPMAAVVVVGTVAFSLHLLGTGFAPQRNGPLFTWIGIGAVGGFAVLIGAVTVISTLRRKTTAPDRVVTAGIMVLLLAASDISVVWNSQLPFGGPPVLDRVFTVLTYATALGLLVAGIRLNRQARGSASAVADAEAEQPSAARG